MAAESVELVVRVAKENLGWGYDRIQGALKNLGLRLSDTTVGNILKEHGIEPAPDRKKQATWTEFLKAHWDVMAAADFTTVEVWTSRGLVTFDILVVMRLSTRQIEIAGVTPNPNAAWMQQMGRNLTDYEDGFLIEAKYLLLDRDTKYLPFCGVLEGTKPEVVLLPPRSPNLNAYVERYMRSMKSECLNRMIFFGESALRRALVQFTEHHHAERNHQGLGNNLLSPGEEVGRERGPIQCRQRLGGMLRYYYRDAA
jgi:hypothetical protein